MASALSLKKVNKSYGSFRALRDLSFSVERGTICGLLGPNGAGKTTTLKLLLGMLRADNGELRALDSDCWADSVNLRSRTGFLSADQTFPGWLTARRAIDLTSQMRGQDLTSPAGKLAEQLDLDLDKAISQMSRGNVQKVGLTLALASEPELLIFDEPTSGLDPLIQETFAQLLHQAQSRGTTILLSSHTFSEVDRLCEQVVVIREGEAVANESLASFRARALRRVRLFVRGDLPSSLPTGLEEVQREERVLHCAWTGPTPPLVAWCAQQELDDVEISAPQLDDAFMEFYR